MKRFIVFVLIFTVVGFLLPILALAQQGTMDWAQATASAGWSARYDHTTVTFDNKIWVLGGNASDGTRKNDVWYSSDGVNWTLATDSAGWSRRNRHASVALNNKIWMLGGAATSRRNDVWYSSDGANWTCATTSAGWTRRRDHASVIFNDKIWVLGGNSRSNDVWYSNGYTATLISPNGGETLPGGCSYTIRWSANATGISQYRLLLSKDGGISYQDTIADNILPSETTYQWTVPYLNLHNARVAVQIIDSTGTVLLQDVSDNNFSIQTIKVISPNGGETFYGGSNQIMRWCTTYPSYVLYRILLTSAGYTYSDTIANNLTQADTIINWTVPLINSTLCRVMVQMLDSSGLVRLQDESDRSFTIHTVSLVSPNGGEYWQGGSNKTIKWRTTTTVNFSHYRLLLSTDAGNTFPDTIAHSVATSESSYNWTVSIINSDLCQVMVEIIDSTGEVLSQDASNDNFIIDSDPPETFSLLSPQNNGWAGNNSVFAWQPSYDNFEMSHYQMAIAIPNETLQITTHDTTFINNQGENWVQATSNAQWTERIFHSSVVFDNKIWVMGGDGEDDVLNDVWFSMDGVNWTQATASAGWTPRASHTSVVFDNKMWIIGGYDYDYLRNDVWYSTDGVNWIQATDSAEWSPRLGHTSFVFDNKMWVLGGTNYDYNFNDVWYSTDGVNWTQATASAEWNTREGHTSVVFDNKIWVLGGNSNDVWYSTDGINWICATDSAAWSRRHYHASVVFDNKMWILGGSWFNDVWYSVDGINWTCATPSAGWSPRNGHTSLVFNTKMWVIGGDWMNDVWYAYITLQIPEGTQSWWVNAYDRAGNVRQSNQTFSVRIDTILPTSSALISPNDSALINDTFVTLIWHSASDMLSGIKTYRLQISSNPGFNPILELDTIISDTTVIARMSNFNMTCWWRVCAIDSADNQSTWSLTRTFTILVTGIEENPFPQIPYLLSLKIYPSPAKSQTSIQYSLPTKNIVSIMLYDISGRLVKTLVHGQKESGIYNYSLNTRQLSTGIYYISFKTDAPKKLIQRLVIVK